MAIRAGRPLLALIRQSTGSGGVTFIRELEKALQEHINSSYLNDALLLLLAQRRRVTLKSVIAAYKEERRRASLREERAKAMQVPTSKGQGRKSKPPSGEKVTLATLRPGPPCSSVRKQVKKAESAKGASVWMVFTPSGGQPGHKHRRHP